MCVFWIGKSELAHLRLTSLRCYPCVTGFEDTSSPRAESQMRQCLHLNWHDICIRVVVHLFARGLLASLPLLAMPPTTTSICIGVVVHLVARGLFGPIASFGNATKLWFEIRDLNWGGWASSCSRPVGLIASFGNATNLWLKSELGGWASFCSGPVGLIAPVGNATNYDTKMWYKNVPWWFKQFMTKMI